MSKKDDFTFFGYHVVCLIDVLGQKQKLARWAKLPEDGQVTPDFIKALKDTAGTVLTFRDQFIKFFDRMNQCTIPDKLAAQPKEKQKQYQRFKECRVKVERFSDTFVFSSQIPNAHGDASITPMYRVLATCCYAMLWSLAGKTPVRGAVSIGAGAEPEDESFYGPGLAEAHYLESEVASYPRIIVSPMVRQFLADGQVYSTNREIAQIMSQMASTCRSFICQDVDGCWIVDFLGKGLRDLLGPDMPSGEAVGMAYEFVRSEASRFREAGNSKLAVRYHLLQQYIESRLPIWGIKQNA